MQRGQWKDELAAPLGDVGKLLGQLGLEVPRQRQHDVGPVLVDLSRIVDRNACSRREATVLVRIAVDGVLEQIAADTAVVEQRVALTGCAVADDPLALGVAVEQEAQQLVADRLSPAAQLAGSRPPDAGRPPRSIRKHLGYTRSLGVPAHSFGRAHTRIEPPCVGISSTSTTARPAVASARIADSTV